MSTIDRKELGEAIMGSKRGAPATSSAAKRVRQTLQKKLRGQFDTFVQHASIADLYLMSEVLLDHDGESLGINAAKPELVLPTIFEAQMGRGVPCFVLVPEHLQAKVTRYADTLAGKKRDTSYDWLLPESYVAKQGGRSAAKRGKK